MARLPQYRRQEIQSAMVNPVADSSSAVAAQAVQQATSSMMATAANIGEGYQKRTNAAAANSFQNIGYEIAWQQQQKRQMEAHQQAVVNEAMLSHHYNNIQRLAVDKLNELRSTMAATPSEVTKAFDDWYSKNVPDMIANNADLKSRSPDVATRLAAKVDGLRTDYYEANKSWGLSKDTENLVNLTKADDEMMAAEARNMINVQDLNMLMARRAEREPARIAAFGEGVAKSTGKALNEEIVNNFVESLTRSDPDQAQAFLDGGNFKEFIKDRDALESNIRSAQARVEQQAEDADIARNTPNRRMVSKLDSLISRVESVSDEQYDTVKTALREELYKAEKLPPTKENNSYYDFVKNTYQEIENLQRIRPLQDIQKEKADMEARRIRNEAFAAEARAYAAEGRTERQIARMILAQQISPEGLDKRREAETALGVVRALDTTKSFKGNMQQIQKARDLWVRNQKNGLVTGKDQQNFVTAMRDLDLAEEKLVKKQTNKSQEFDIWKDAEELFNEQAMPLSLPAGVKVGEGENPDAVLIDYRRTWNSGLNKILNKPGFAQYRNEPWTMPEWDTISTNLRTQTTNLVNGISNKK